MDRQELLKGLTLRLLQARPDGHALKLSLHWPCSTQSDFTLEVFCEQTSQIVTQGGGLFS